ncbi:MAG: DNA-processing protein DprA [Bacillota bacterium]
MDERECTIALNMVSTIGGARLASLIQCFGSAREALLAREDALLRVEGIGPVTVQRIAEVRDGRLLRDELQRADGLGVNIVTTSDPGYPERLLNIDHPPPVLYVKGEILPRDGLAIAVVGARRATRYGREVARLVAGEAAGAGFTIVSGMARGVDSAAHRGALDTGGRTIAVLGCGVDVVYPPENEKLAEEIAGNGALVSERCLGTRPYGQNFPARNRIISGLSLGVVVVEARETSGALITAKFALEQGRDVFAVPGDIRSPLSRGTHQLIRDGARLVEGIGDILEELGMENVAAPETHGTREESSLRLSARERRVLAALDFSPASADDIVDETGLGPRDVAVALAGLEVRGLVARALDGYVRRAKEGG